MAVPTEVSKSALTFEPDIFRKNAFLQLPQNQHDGIFGFTCDYVYRQNRVQTHRHTHTNRTTTVTLAAHAREG